MGRSSKFLYLILFLAIVGFATYGFLTEKEKFESNIDSKNKEQASISNDAPIEIMQDSAPYSLSFSNEKNLKVGECVPIKFEAFDLDKKKMNKASFSFVIFENRIYPITLHKTKDCSSDPNPSHVYKSINGAGEQTVYGIFTMLEIPTIEAYDFGENTIIIDKKGMNPLNPNFTKVKIIIDDHPEMIQEYKKFEIKCHITDLFGNEVDNYDGKISLFLGKGTELDRSNLLAESHVSNGVAKFSNIMIEKTVYSELIFQIALDNGIFTSVIIPKELFVPRNIKVNIQGEETVSGYFSGPDTVVVFGDNYYITSDSNNRLTVTIRGKRYYVASFDYNNINLRPY